MRDYLSGMFWFNVGKYGALAVLFGASWIASQPWFPHHHTGYVSMSGYVHKCSRCGRLPAGAVRPSDQSEQDPEEDWEPEEDPT